MATVFYDKASVSVEWGSIGETLLASDFTINYEMLLLILLPLLPVRIMVKMETLLIF